MARGRGIGEQRGSRRGEALAALALLLIAALAASACKPGAGDSLDAGLGLLRAELRGMVVAREPQLHILRALAKGGELGAGESLMLRARLSRPAFLALLAQRPGGAAEPIWPAVSALHEAGEFELDEGDGPLLLEPRQLRFGVVLALLACPKSPDAAALRTRIALDAPAEIARAFPDCTVVVLPFSGAGDAR